MKTACNRCSHCDPVKDCDTCPACLMLLDVAKNANMRNRRLTAGVIVCAIIAAVAVLAAVIF